MTDRAYYPWTGRCEKLSAFLERACLRNFYSILKKKLKINDPIDFARFKPTDLTYLGMTGNEINRLVNQLMEDGFPVGSLLSDENADCGHLFTDSEPYPVTGFHRSKLLRKIFRKKQSFYTSAPVSPAHRPEYRSINQFPIHRPQIHVPFRSTSLTDDRKSSLVQNNCESATVNPATCTCLIPEKDIKLYSRIGIGSFGIVRRGDWTMPTGETELTIHVNQLHPRKLGCGSMDFFKFPVMVSDWVEKRIMENIPVAVKLLRPEAMKNDLCAGFLYEVRAMQCLSHPSLIRLHGIVLSNPVMMVTELAPLGSLLLHLRAQSMCARNNGCEANLVSNLPSVPRALQTDALWDMGIQIVCGMAYLTAQGLVHRDLAARNILISSIQKNEYPQIKIADFGLVRSVHSSTVDKSSNESSKSNHLIYTSCSEQKIPFAWSAPESLRKRVFSEASDVWSLGVTFWEMWTGGADPWRGINAERLLEILDSGRRLVWPRFTCPRRLYQLMLACWRNESHRRPTFSYLAERLDRIRPIIVIATQNLDEADRLGLEAGDTLIVIDGKSQDFWWCGQNRRTGEIGSFPRGIVKRGNVDTLTSDYISQPVRDSFLHTEHIRKNGTGWSSLQHDASNESHSVHNVYGPSLSLPNREKRAVEKCNASKSEKSGNCMEFNLLPFDDWSPMQKFSFIEAENVSICCTTDSYSSYGYMLTNASTLNAPNLEVYDESSDEEDERKLLDKIPGSTVGLKAYNVELRKYPNSKLISSHRNSVANCEGNFNDSEVYTYGSLTMLPPPPGPEENETIISEDDRNEQFADLIQLTKSKTTPKHISSNKESHIKFESNSRNNRKVENCITPSTSETTIHSKQSFSLDNLLDGINSIDDNDNKCQPSAPPLIDLYSRIPDPPIFTPKHRITVPTAPIYTPSVLKPGNTYCSVISPRTVAPIYLPNPFLFTNCNVSAQFTCYPRGQYFLNPFYPHHQERMQKSYCASDQFISPTSYNMNHSVMQMSSFADNDNPFDLNNLKSNYLSSSTDEISTLNKHNNKCSVDIFDFAFNGNDNSNNKNTLPSTTCDDSQHAVDSVQTPAVRNPLFSIKQPVHPSNRLENDLLVRSCSDKNSSSSFPPVVTISSPCSTDQLNPIYTPTKLSIGNSAMDGILSDAQPQLRVNENYHQFFKPVDIVTDEISLVCSQVPGCTLSEAHWALLHVMNPFSPVIPQLIVPPIPCTAPVVTWRTRFDRTSAWRVNLAVRLLSVCRLYQLSLINWDSCCEIISAFNWQLEPAADWILDHMTPSCFI